jgi:hypothetical protein
MLRLPDKCNCRPCVLSCYRNYINCYQIPKIFITVCVTNIDNNKRNDKWYVLIHDVTYPKMRFSINIAVSNDVEVEEGVRPPRAAESKGWQIGMQNAYFKT